jgi:hypothetical protein
VTKHEHARHPEEWRVARRHAVEMCEGHTLTARSVEEVCASLAGGEGIETVAVDRDRHARLWPDTDRALCTDAVSDCLSDDRDEEDVTCRACLSTIRASRKE